jgi:2-amino-4-hydroxy-6-hydroxymethyldihydropteridine diphosphokinase
MIFLGLGSNMGDRETNIISATAALAHCPGINIIRLSSLYETIPVGYRDQADFLNAVVEISTSLSPAELLEACLGVERDMGRIRTLHWGPRIIDIDLLLYDDVELATDNLVLPHPRMHERGFVLVPLAEISPAVVVSQGMTAMQLLAGGLDEGVVFYKRTTWEVNA